MQRLSSVKWAVLGALGLALLWPGGVVNAAVSTTLVTIAGANGGQASVTKAHQVLAAESDPANAVVLHASVANGGCATFYTVPAGRALVVKTLVFTANFVSTDTGATDDLFDTGICNGSGFWATAQFGEPAGTFQSQPQDLGPGAVFPSGTNLNFGAGGATLGSGVFLYGYTIPAAAAPAKAHVLDRGTGKEKAPTG